MKNVSIFTQKDSDKLAKVNINTLFDLALCIPNSYEDLQVYTHITGSSQFLDVSINSIRKSDKVLTLSMFCHNLGFTVEANFFSYRPYVLRQFVEGERYYLFGKVLCTSGHCKVSHPKKIDTFGFISSVYKCKIKNTDFKKLITKYLTHINLSDLGLNSTFIDNLIEIHFPRSQVYDKNDLPFDMINTLKYIELYNHMKILKDKKRYFKSHKMLKANIDYYKDSLEFKLTSDQINAISDVESDLLKDTAAKRMIVGDVGSGKTMVILASAFISGKDKSILMAPTTILANQLFDEANKILKHLNIALVTNKTSKKEDLSKYDFLIGTHALLYRDLPNVALVMVDEQHRFGTAQRNLLEKLVSKNDKRPHYLQFSATPIPRTQAMIDSSHIDVSLITQTPFKKDIESTVIHKEDFSDLLLHIEEEISHDRQVLIIYPLVEENEAFEYQALLEGRLFWEKNFDDVYVTHGKDKDKEKVLEQFRDKGKILLATTVVEVGISLPKLSTIIIVGAERLGLSTLHQLRGRVSRTGLKGYCYLYTNSQKSPRLEQFCKTTNGFDIAALDLKFRKSGDILVGREQSGESFKFVDLAEDEDIVKSVKEDLTKKLELF